MGSIRAKKPVKEPEMKWLLRKRKAGECDAWNPWEGGGLRRAGRGLRCVEQSRKPKTDLAEGSWWTWGEQFHSGDGRAEFNGLWRKRTERKW